MTYKRNAGKFNRRVTLQQPSVPVRDNYGGIARVTYSDAVTVWAMVTTQNQRRGNYAGDNVTEKTKYFVIRELDKTVQGVNTDWRIKLDNQIYNISDVLLIDESAPYYTQITATAIGE